MSIRRLPRMNQSDLAASRRLLRVRRKRPNRRSAADQRDELASPHISSQSSDDSIVSAETGTLIGTETIGAAHSQRLGWVILVRTTWSRRSRHVRFAPIASVIWHHSDVTRRADCAKVTAEKL